jgi:hypothetical protein
MTKNQNPRAAHGKGTQKVKAIELLLNYGLGKPRAELALEHSGSAAEQIQQFKAVFLAVADGFP